MLEKLGYKKYKSNSHNIMNIEVEYKKYSENGKLLNSITFYNYKKFSTLLSINYEELKAIEEKIIELGWI